MQKPNRPNTRNKRRLLNGIMDRFYSDPDTYQKRRLARGRGAGKSLVIAASD